MPTEIDRHQVQSMLGQGAQLIDVMGRPVWEESHITGAIHIPLEKIPEWSLEQLDPHRPVITYCYDSL